MGKPLTRGALSVFPLWNGQAVTAPGYDLRYGNGGHGVSVAERAGAAVVGELVVGNSGPRPALVLEGELLEGGQQHRVACRSLLVEAGTSHVLEVRCVERGRGTGAAEHPRNGRRAPVTVRAAQAQGLTWERVLAFEQRYGASATGSLLAATRGAERAARELVADLRPLPGQCGLVLCLAGQPIALEAFECPRSLATAWRPLLGGAAVDALGLPAIATPTYRARRFVDQVARVAMQPCEGGLGSGWQGRSDKARLGALSWRGRTVHLTAVNPRHELVRA